MVSALSLSPMFAVQNPPDALALAPIPTSPPMFPETRYSLSSGVDASVLPTPLRLGQFAFDPLDNAAEPIDGGAEDLLPSTDGPPHLQDVLDDPLTIVRLSGFALLVTGVLLAGIAQRDASQARRVAGGTFAAFGGIMAIGAL